MVWDIIRDVFDKFLGIVASFRFTDFLDIIAVAFILYKFIQLVRETRAVQFVKGVVIIGSIYIIVTLCNMNAMEYLLRNLFSVGFLAAIVLLQPEIRRAIEQMGRSRIGIFKTFGRDYEKIERRNEIEICVQSICKACENMSDKRIGALIVIERLSMLGEIVKTGTVLDAQPSTDLIKNVFYPKSPLHDGAMIVRDGKIYAAGCILPLTANREISSELGTRHRAAIGMSEESDALVVVVSEETGFISIAEKGKLNRDLEVDELRSLLHTGIFGETDEDDNEKNMNKVTRIWKEGFKWKRKK